MKGFENKYDANRAMQLSFGRILRMGSRAEQPGDTQEYFSCRDLFFDAAEYLGYDTTEPHTHNYARDYNK